MCVEARGYKEVVMGLVITLMGMGYGLAETAYFGWNMHPHSDAEMTCDGIALLIAAIGLATSRS